jgi:hypothetical protein
MPSDKPPPRTAPEQAKQWRDEVNDAAAKAAIPKPQGGQPGGGGTPLNLGERGDDGGLENSEQRQLDRELAAIGREERPGLPDKSGSGGENQVAKGTSLTDNSTSHHP